MRKIKVYLIILISIILFPYINVSAANSRCSVTQIEQYRSQLTNVNMAYEIMPEGTKVHNEMLASDIDVSNKAKVTIENLPEEFYIIFNNITDENLLFPPLVQGGTMYLSGGVYTLEISHEECPEPIKKFEVLVPFYNKDSKDVWFDGTYEQKNKQISEKEKSKTNIRLVIIIIILSIIIVALIIFLFRKRQLK